MSIQTQLERLENLRDELRIHLIGMNLVGAEADLEECVRALQTVISHGYTFTGITSPSQRVDIQRGYYPEGAVVGIPEEEAEKINNENIRSGVSVLGIDGTFTEDATAGAEDIMYSKTAYSGGEKITGIIRKQTLSLSPSKDPQTVFADPGYVISAVTVGAIPSNYGDVSATTAGAEDVLSPKKFVSADGNILTGQIEQIPSEEVILHVGNETYSVEKGYHDGTGKVSVVTETKQVPPLKSQRTVTPTSGKVLSSVIVQAIPDKYQDITVTTLTADMAISGSRFINSEGISTFGTMPHRGSVTATFDGIEVTSYSIPQGYHAGRGTVSLTNDIELALSAI